MSEDWQSNSNGVTNINAAFATLFKETLRELHTLIPNDAVRIITNNNEIRIVITIINKEG